MKKVTIFIISVFFTLTTAAQDFKTMDSLTRMGFLYSQQREYSKSNECFRKVSTLYSMIGRDTLAFKAMEMITRNRADSLRFLATSYSEQKDYIKANEYYEMALFELQSLDDSEAVIAKVNNAIALNHIRMGHAFLNKKNYEEARQHYQIAVENAIPDSEAYNMALRGVGNTYSRQATELNMEHYMSNANLEPALNYCLNAEHYYDLASATELGLKEQLSRAGILVDLSQAKEGMALYLQVFQECEGKEEYNGIKGKAAYGLGSIYKDQEQFKDAIEFLEIAYELCIAADNKQNAYFAADKLSDIFKNQVPDSEKEIQWGRRADVLKTDLPSLEEYIQQTQMKRQKTID